jgi:hypothetical protein
MRDPSGDENVPVKISLLVMLAYCSFTRCSHWGGNWVKDTWLSLYHFLQLHMSIFKKPIILYVTISKVNEHNSTT